MSKHSESVTKKAHIYMYSGIIHDTGRESFGRRSCTVFQSVGSKIPIRQHQQLLACALKSRIRSEMQPREPRITPVAGLHKPITLIYTYLAQPTGQHAPAFVQISASWIWVSSYSTVAAAAKCGALNRGVVAIALQVTIAGMFELQLIALFLTLECMSHVTISFILLPDFLFRLCN